MNKFVTGTLTALFIATVANIAQADPVSDRLDEGGRLNGLYHDMGSTMPELSNILFLPSINDDAAYADLGFDGPNKALNISALMSFVVGMKFDADVPAQDIYDHVINDEFVAADRGLEPVSLSALVKTPTAAKFACMAFVPAPNPDVEKEIKAFTGQDEYMGNDGFMHDAVNYKAPYTYHADMPISAEAWHNFKTHYTAAQCLVDHNNPFQLDEHTKADYILNAATGFAALMTARDGRPEILAFLADYLAASVHNTGSYDASYVYAQLIDKNAGLYDGMGTSWREGQSGGYQMSYVVPLLDSLKEEWKNCIISC